MDTGTEPASAPNQWRYYGQPSPTAVAEARRNLDGWVREHGGQDIAADVVLACWEAMSNVLQHAYRGARGPLDMRASVRDQTLTVSIVDNGQWRTPDADGDGDRGQGLRLIQALTDALDLSSRGGGTTLTLSWPLPRHGRTGRPDGG